MARPPRPETETGSGGAVRLEYAIVAVIFQELIPWSSGLKIRHARRLAGGSGPGSNACCGLWANLRIELYALIILAHFRHF